MMDLTSNKPIYLQICDDISEKILSGEYAPDSRIPSVREYGASIGVNPNTVMRSYERLTSDGIIYISRGVGYFIAPEAKEMVLNRYKKDFLENELPQILNKMRLLGLDPKEILGKTQD